jgi:hypothetical protein
VLGHVIDLKGIEEGDSRVMSCTGREAGTRAAGAALISGACAHVASGITHQNGCISGPWKQAESGVGTGGDGALPRGRVIDSSIPASTTLTSFLLRGRLQGNLPTASFRRGLADQD